MEGEIGVGGMRKGGGLDSEIKGGEGGRNEVREIKKGIVRESKRGEREKY